MHGVDACGHRHLPTRPAAPVQRCRGLCLLEALAAGVPAARAGQEARATYSDDVRAIFCHACDLLGVRWTTAPRTVYVSRKADVALLDEFIGPKS